MAAYPAHAVNDDGLAGRAFALRLVGDERPQLLDVDRRAEEVVLLLVVVPHADLAEITRVVFVHHDPVVVLSARIATAARVLTVLSDATLSMRHGTTHGPGLLANLLDDRL